MESFILSTSLAFLIFEALAYTRLPKREEYEFSIGQISIKFGKGSATWARRILQAVLVSAILFFLLILHEIVLPFDVISRNRDNITLGFFCGPIFGMWLNSIIRHPPEQALDGCSLPFRHGLTARLAALYLQRAKFAEHYNAIGVEP
jgi:hypothetical protein